VNPDLIKVTEIFLVPSSFLVAALGTADTNPHRAAVSLVGLIVSILWQVCSLEAMSVSAGDASTPLRTVRRQVLGLLPLVFIVGWFGSTVIHLLLWGYPLGG